MVTLVNRAKMSTSTTGTGTITLGSAETGYQSFADAGVADGDVIRYVIEDGDAWEIGSGTYTATGTTLTRTVDESSNSDAALNLTGSAVVFITAAAEDVFQGELFAESYDGTTTAPNATGTNAFAIGVQSTSSATNSVAIGTGAYVTHQGGVGLGYSPTVTANYGAAIGANSAGAGAKVSGAGGVALGGSNTQGSEAFSAVIDNTTTSYGATGAYSMAMGYRSKSTAQGAVAFGFEATGSANYSVALGRSNASGADGFAAGIANSSTSFGATGSNSVALGYQATASGQYSYASGSLSTASGYGSISIGISPTASGHSSIALGGRGVWNAQATAQSSIAIGDGARSAVKGKMAFAGYGMGNAGSQGAWYTLYSDTTDATAEAMTTTKQAASSDNQIVLSNTSALSFHGTIVAREDATDGTDCAAWEVKGLIRREASASTTTLVNSSTTVVDNTPSWGMALSADTTNGCLKIQVTGAASTNIRWVATIHTSEVIYA